MCPEAARRSSSLRGLCIGSSVQGLGASCKTMEPEPSIVSRHPPTRRMQTGGRPVSWNQVSEGQPETPRGNAPSRASGSPRLTMGAEGGGEELGLGPGRSGSRSAPPGWAWAGRSCCTGSPARSASLKQKVEEEPPSSPRKQFSHQRAVGNVRTVLVGVIRVTGNLQPSRCGLDRDTTHVQDIL